MPPDVPSSSVVASSHEVLEWMDDPFADNVVPEWALAIAPSICGGDLLEVADPVNNILFVLPGAPGYLLTDAAYLPWFTREQPSSAWNGQYDVLGATQGPLMPCTGP